MQVIQYGDKYGVFTGDGEMIEGGFGSREAANEAKRNITNPPVEYTPKGEPQIKRGRAKKHTMEVQGNGEGEGSREGSGSGDDGGGAEAAPAPDRDD